ncbi:hypothetical protein NP493_1309g01001 [Ridgeia piscesae]|uniref:Uncharacterized protein n=1 Tax=Ridgeia piscesae TaxID=27915 RepID=A0AAD9K8J3_RIDPI|nr:hypothetical protein NP493_1309g01001 [Ridgeia piscesae]
MVCIFCDIHINNNVLSSFVFSLQYLCHKKNHRINQLIIGISESVQDLILCRCICGYCNVLCTRNLNLIELFHRPHRVPQYFSTIVKQIYFCMAVACGGATVHKKSVFYCIILGAPKTQSILVIWFLRRSLEMTPYQFCVLGICLLACLLLLSGSLVNSVSMRPVDSGLSRVLCFNQGTFLQ